MKRGDPLSERELECLCLLTKGKHSVAIGMALGIADQTVRTHLHRASVKMGARSMVELAVKAVRCELLPRCRGCVGGDDDS